MERPMMVFCLLTYLRTSTLQQSEILHSSISSSIIMLRRLSQTLTTRRSSTHNEKFSTESIGSGFFRKKGSTIKNWKQRRYEIYTDGILHYFDPTTLTKSPFESKGFINCNHCQIIDGQDQNLTDCGFNLYQATLYDAEPLSQVQTGETVQGYAITIITSNESNQKELELVFDTLKDLCHFLVLITRVAINTNTLEYVNKKRDETPGNLFWKTYLEHSNVLDHLYSMAPVIPSQDVQSFMTYVETNSSFIHTGHESNSSRSSVQDYHRDSQAKSEDEIPQKQGNEMFQDRDSDDVNEHTISSHNDDESDENHSTSQDKIDSRANSEDNPSSRSRDMSVHYEEIYSHDSTVEMVSDMDEIKATINQLDTQLSFSPNSNMADLVSAVNTDDRPKMARSPSESNPMPPIEGRKKSILKRVSIQQGDSMVIQNNTNLDGDADLPNITENTKIEKKSVDLFDFVNSSVYQEIISDPQRINALVWCIFLLWTVLSLSLYRIIYFGFVTIGIISGMRYSYEKAKKDSPHKKD